MKNHNNEFYFQLEVNLRNAWDKYNFYMNTAMPKNMPKHEEFILGGYTTREVDIKSIPAKDNLIFVRLKEYQDAKEVVCSILSTLVRNSLGSVDSLVKLVSHLDDKYNKDSELHNIYQDCYLDSVLPAVNIAVKYSFAHILKMLIATQDAPAITALSALHLKHSLTFSILLNNPISSSNDKKELAEIAYYQPVDTFILKTQFKNALYINKERSLDWVRTNQDMIKYFIPKFEDDITKFSDILITLINHYEIGLMINTNAITGLREIYQKSVNSFIERKKPLFEEQLFWKLTHCSNQEFFEFLKLQQSTQFKQLALLSKLIVNNNENTYSVVLTPKIAEKPLKHTSVSIPKKEQPQIVKSKVIMTEKTLNYSDDDIEVIENIATKNSNDTQIENSLFFSIRYQFNQMVDKLKLVKKDTQDAIKSYLNFNKNPINHIDISKTFEESLNLTFNDEVNIKEMLALIDELKLDELDVSGNINNNVEDWTV